MPPNVEKLFEMGPKKLNPPKIINKGINSTSATAINQEDTTGKLEKKSILRIKPRGVLGDWINELNFGKPYSKKIQAKQSLMDHSESIPNLVCAIGSVNLLRLLMRFKL